MRAFFEVEAKRLTISGEFNDSQLEAVAGGRSYKWYEWLLITVLDQGACLDSVTSGTKPVNYNRRRIKLHVSLGVRILRLPYRILDSYFGVSNI